MSIIQSTAICTWLVIDDAEVASYFPQVGLRSDNPKAHEIYWRCVCVFFATSISHNKGARHIFFTNSDIPAVDGFDIGKFFARNDIEVIKLPVIHRLPLEFTESWGNQMYVLDIICALRDDGKSARYILLDSDCVWTRDVTSMASDIDEHGALTLALPDEPQAELINGVSERQLADFLRLVTGVNFDRITYLGGEIFAATQREVVEIAERVSVFWDALTCKSPPPLREEAHFLSCIYAALSYRLATANPHIKRMWTGFRFRNVTEADLSLAVWHLPWEKRSGFCTAFKILRRSFNFDAPIGAFNELTIDDMAKLMGVPQRGYVKLFRDIGRKASERLSMFV